MKLDRVRAEIVDLHDRFEAWYRDEPGTGFADIAAAIPHDFVFVAPSGETVPPAQLLAGIEQARGSRDISIRIENVELVLDVPEGIVARYEEWHDHTDYSTCRQSTVVFVPDDTRPNGLQWRLVHETWKVPPPSRS